MADDAVVVDRALTRGGYFRVLMLMTLRRPYVLVLMVLSIAMLGYGLATDLYPALFIVIFIFIFAYAPFAGLRVVYDRRNRNMFRPVRLTFREAEIEIDSELSRGTVSWGAYYDWRKIGRYYVLMMTSRQALLIPVAGLATEDEARLVDLLHENIKDHH
jgi:hypothetical protein